MKLILLVSVLKGSERISAARLYHASGEVAINLSFRRGLHVEKHWLEWTRFFKKAVCALYSHNG